MNSYIQISTSFLFSCICYRIMVIIQTFLEEQRRSVTPEVLRRVRRDRKYLSVSNEFEDGLHECFTFFFHMSYIGVYVINRIHAAGQTAVVRLFIHTSVLRGKNLNVGQNAKTSFSTETSESSGHFTKERINDEIFPVISVKLITHASSPPPLPPTAPPPPKKKKKNNNKRNISTLAVLSCST